MDISRPDLEKSKGRRTAVLVVSALVLLAIAGFFVLRLKPALATVESDAIWTDTLKLGSLLSQVRGPGSLVPREDRIRLIPFETEAPRVRLRVLPGARVQRDTILMDLVYTELPQQFHDAELQAKAAQADLINTHVRLLSDLMTQRAGAATVGEDQKQAQLRSQTDKSLYDLGVISGITYSASEGKSHGLNIRNELEQQRLTLSQKALITQMAVQQTRVEQADAVLTLKRREQAALSVRAGISGALVELPHQVGEHVALRTALAKVVQPDELKALLKVAETRARDVHIGQAAEIDTHNGVIPARVTRIDPSVQNGTVTVDPELLGKLPQDAQPDFSVDGTIGLDLLRNVLYVGTPAVGKENSTIDHFKVSSDGKAATRVPVKVGRASINSIQIFAGLQPGDKIILSDMSRWDAFNRIQIQTH